MATIPSHRILAVNRGEREGVLAVKLNLAAECCIAAMLQLYPPDPESPFAPHLREAVEDSYRRLVAPAIEREIRASLTEKDVYKRQAREQAEQSFQENFVARLGEFIKLAQEEIKELNRALKDMRFGTDSYHFSLTPKKDTRRYYEMIMDTGVYQGCLLYTSRCV